MLQNWKLPLRSHNEHVGVHDMAFLLIGFPLSYTNFNHEPKVNMFQLNDLGII